MATVTKPMALDESFNTTENTSRNVADVLAEGLSDIADAVTPKYATDIEMSTTDPDKVADRITAIESTVSGKQDIIAKGGVTSLDANTLYGSFMTRTYRCVSGSISNCPQTDGTLMVFSNGDGYSTVQMFITTGGGGLYIRVNWGAGSVSWGAWKTVNLT